MRAGARCVLGRGGGRARRQVHLSTAGLALFAAQMEYYFSQDNLTKDTFLVSKMNEQFYVSIDLLASFSKIKTLTPDRDVVVAALKMSEKLEVQPRVARAPVNAFVLALVASVQWARAVRILPIPPQHVVDTHTPRGAD